MEITDTDFVTGRVNVLDLQPVLNVDLAHIEAKVAELLKKDKRLQLINGEIITRYEGTFCIICLNWCARYYLDGIAVEINEMLQEAGQLNLYELSSRFALPLLCLETVSHLFCFSFCFVLLITCRWLKNGLADKYKVP